MQQPEEMAAVPEHPRPATAAGGQGSLTVEVCYGAASGTSLAGAQFLVSVRVDPGTSIHQAIRLSGLLEKEAGTDLSRYKVGIHGKVKPLDTLLRDGDRVEIYRPLLVDPMAARRRRASVKG